jgi:hypothetical protein
MESYLDSEIDTILNGRAGAPHTFRDAADDSPIVVQRLMQDAERLSSALKAKNRYYGTAGGAGDVDTSPAALRVAVNDLELRLSTVSSTISKILKEIENLAKELLEFQKWRASRTQTDEDDERHLHVLSAQVSDQQHAREALSASVRNLEARVQNTASHADLSTVMEVQRALRKEMHGYARQEDVAPLEKMLGHCINQTDFTDAIARLKTVVIKEIHTTLDDNLAKALDTQDKDLRAAIRLELRKLEARLEDSMHEQVTASRNAMSSSISIHRSPDRETSSAVNDLREDVTDVQAEMKSIRKRMEAQDEVIDGLLSKCDLLAEDNRRLRNLRVRIVEESAELKNVKDAVIDQDDKLERLTADMHAMLAARVARTNDNHGHGSIVRAPSPVSRTTFHRSPSPPLIHHSRPSSRSVSPLGPSSSQARSVRRSSGAGITVPRLSPGSATMEYDRELFSSRRRDSGDHPSRPYGTAPRSISPVSAAQFDRQPSPVPEQSHFVRRGGLQQHHHRYSGQNLASSTSSGGPGASAAQQPRLAGARTDATSRIQAKSPNRHAHPAPLSEPGRATHAGATSTARPLPRPAAHSHSSPPHQYPARSSPAPTPASGNNVSLAAGTAGATGSSYWSTDAVRHLSISQFESSVDSDTTV